MSTRTVFKLTVNCEDTSNNIISHRLWSPDIPSSCPLGVTGHTLINVIITDRVSSKIHVVEDDTEGTAGRYRCNGYTYDVAAGPDTDFQLVGTSSLPYPIRAYVFTLQPTDENIGDYFTFLTAPNTPIGTLTQAVSSGTVLNVDDNVIAYIGVGIDVTLNDGVTSQNLGECISIDDVNNTITVSNSVSNSFGIGTPVLMTIKRIENVRITTKNQMVFGANTIGSTFVPPGINGVLMYKNMTNVAKKISASLEIAY
jgi:hypothetical protein